MEQVMSAGSIPVFVARDFVRPFREQIDWPSFSFIFTPDQVQRPNVDNFRLVFSIITLAFDGAHACMFVVVVVVLT